MLEGLIHALYELPKKAVSFAVVEPTSCGNAKFHAEGYAQDLNFVADIHAKAGSLKEYAIGGIDKVETYLRAKDYVMNCDPSWVNSKLTPLTENANRLVDYAIEYAHAEGREIPFTGNPVLDLMIAGGILGGFTLGMKYLSKVNSKLFPDYSNVGKI